MNVKVRYIFSRNKKIGSRLISWGTKHLQPEVKPTASHVAILVNEKYVFESTLETGIRVITYKRWKQLNEELYSVECIQDWTMQDLKDLYRPLKLKKYDYMGIVYFSYRIALNILFKKPIPKINLFNHTDRYFCCEVISEMTGVSYEMTSPVELYYKLNGGIPNAKKEER